ncbi:MAG: carboxymuconolactone decarboxylase family protein [Pseudomonadota bacterium]
MTTKDYRASENYQKGVATRASKYEPTPTNPLETLYEFSPELADVVVAHGLGDIWVNKTPNLSVQMKEIAVLSSLITSGAVQIEVKNHAQCLLNVGVTKQQIKELLILLTLYIGVPKVLLARVSIDEAFKEYDAARASTENV